MKFTDPHAVLTPKSRVSDLQVICAGSGEGSWSVARLHWDGQPRLGIRWNGDANNPIGNPQSRGLATWFVVPPELAAAVETAALHLPSPLEAGYREMASDEQAESAAKDWSEALIADAAGSPSEAW